MRKTFFIALLLLSQIVLAQSNTDWGTTIVFPADYKVGEYIEFVGVHPTSAGASGNYEISIAYTRGNVAAAATHLASISHSNPDIWREVGRVNNNGYRNPNAYFFTIDCNTQYGTTRFRIRAISVLGITTSTLPVEIKVRSINQNSGWTVLNATGTDLTVNKFLPMTGDWNLYVGNSYSTDGANLAIRAIDNGNVGIGTATPKEKLSVNGNIRAKEVKVETKDWPDYVFTKDYALPSLEQTEKHIKANGHLPGIPSAKEVEIKGVDLGEMNAKLLQKIEEITLQMIELNKIVKKQGLEISNLRKK